MSNSHYLAYAVGGLTRTNLFLEVSPNQSTEFEYQLKGESEYDTIQHRSGGFDIPLPGVSCVPTKEWNEIDLHRELQMLWQIRDDESEEASELRQLLEDFVQERMQRIALDNFSAFESPTEWLEMGDGLESVAKDIRDTGLSINDGVAAAIAKMKAEAAEDAVVFESEDWRDLRSRLLVALQECNGDSLRLV